MVLSFDQRVVVRAGVLVRPIQDEAVILDMDSERYLGLSPVAARMWELLVGAPTIEAAFESLLAEYEVEAERLREELGSFVAQLVDQRLIELVHAQVA